ncbi:DUF3800 domain-containing protein [Candidatus Parcubacteria bacterium]|nr:DUF3800 domain-containing protein [Candidatus Parcubacteria bacterium]
MKFIFIDEIEQHSKNKNFFGLGAILIDSANYSKFKNEANKHFKKLKWPEKIEFKGRYLFSQKVDKNITIEERINFVNEFSKMSVATKNARYSFLFSYNFKKKTKNNYLLLLGKITNKIPAPSSCKGDRCLVAVFCDNGDIVSLDDIYDTILKKLKNKLIIFERPFCINSDNKTFGIMTVDILCYLKSWIELSEDDKAAQKTLFNPIIGSIDKRKLMTIKNIISNVKNMKVIK